MSQTGFNLPLIHSYRPRSFRERGLAAPFTTPMLLGARLRQPIVGMGQDGQRHAGPGLEVIVPNPSGGRGVYILPWGNVAALGRPTIHDVVLGRVLSGLLGTQGGDLTPRLLAEAVSQTALQGLAGRPVAAAVAAAEVAAKAAVVAARSALVLQITEVVEGPDPPRGPVAADTRENIDLRGFAALAAVAAELGQPPQHVVNAVDQIATLFADIGIGSSIGQALMPRLVLALAAVSRDLTGWAQAEAGEALHGETRDALAVSGAAELTARMGARFVEQARAQLANPREALKGFLTNPAKLQSLCDRPSWLLNGWDMICRLWSAAPGVMPQHQAIQEMARSLPVLPDETEHWLGLPPGSVEQIGRLPAMALTRRDPAAHSDRVARLERMRAASV